MGNKEKQTGVIDKGLEGYKKFNKITLTVGVSAGTAGVIFGMPWLAALGFASAAVDGAQIVAIREVQKRKNKKELKNINNQEARGKIINFPRSGIIYQPAA